MVKHIVMWNIQEHIQESEADMAKQVKDQLEGLKEVIHEVITIEVGINFNSGPGAYDLVLYTEFEDEDALNIYQNHPEHLKVVEFVKTVLKDRVAADYYT